MGLFDKIFGSKATETTSGSRQGQFQQRQDETRRDTTTSEQQRLLSGLRRGTSAGTTGVDVGAPGVGQTLQFLLGQQGQGDVGAGRTALTDIASGASKNNLLELLASRSKAFQADLPFLINKARGLAFGSPRGAAEGAVAEVTGRAAAGEEAANQQLIAEILGQQSALQLQAGGTLFGTPQAQALGLLQQLGRRTTGDTTETTEESETAQAKQLLDSVRKLIASGTSSESFTKTGTGRERKSIFDIGTGLLKNLGGAQTGFTLPG